MTSLRITLTGAVEGGKFHPDDKGRWHAWAAYFDKRRVVVTLEAEHKRHSDKQRAWYRAEIVPAYAARLSVGRELPLSNDQAHIVMCAAFLGLEDTPLGPVAKSTRDLDTAQMSTYCEKLVAHAATEWGMHIRTPEEWWANRNAEEP